MCQAARSSKRRGEPLRWPADKPRAIDMSLRDIENSLYRQDRLKKAAVLERCKKNRADTKQKSCVIAIILLHSTPGGSSNLVDLETSRLALAVVQETVANNLDGSNQDALRQTIHLEPERGGDPNPPPFRYCSARRRCISVPGCSRGLSPQARPRQEFLSISIYQNEMSHLVATCPPESKPQAPCSG